MDKLVPVFQPTPVSVQSAFTIGNWYETEVTSGYFSNADLAWMMAQGWRVSLVINYPTGEKFYQFTRRVLKPEKALKDLISSYTDAYNDCRQLNDQRYDDLLVLWLSVLDKTENSFNTLETKDTTFEGKIETLITAIESDQTSYDADVDGHLATFGTTQTADINARFDSESTKAKQALIDRGVYSTTLWTTMSAGIERERNRALNDLTDRITLQELEIKHRVQAQRVSSRDRIVASRERLRSQLRDGVDRQVLVRNQVAESLHRLVEGRTDSYPDMSEVGKVAGLLGAGSPEAYTP